ALPRTRDGERAGRDVLSDDRPGGGVSAVAQRDRRDERRVHAGLDAGAERGPGLGLGLAVVVGGDGGRAEVAVGTDVGVADVAQVRALRALADVGALDLDEGPGLGVGAQAGARAQVGEGADRDAVLDRRAVDIGALDRTALADRGGAFDRRAGLDGRV